jgi:hypothetical protein
MTKKLRTFAVTIPIAGHAFLEVEATSEEEAIELAMNKVTIDDVESWEAVEQFNKGNVCYCPAPWEATAEDTEAQ